MRAPRPTYANITATLALLLATSGTAYAAATLPPNSVGTSQLKANAVTSAKIKDGGVGLADLSSGVKKAITPKAYFGNNPTIQFVTTSNPVGGTPLTLGSVAVPPGNYFVDAELRAFSSDANPVGLFCSIDNDGPTQIVNVRTAGGVQQIPMTGVIANSDGVIQIDCFRANNGASNNITVTYVLTAIQVN